MTATTHVVTQPMNTRWRLEMFGGMRLLQEGRIVDKFPTRKTAALLAYLAYSNGKAIARDLLAEMFWPDNDPEASRNSLRVALNALRKLLVQEMGGADVLQADRSIVRLQASAFVTDVAEFEAALKEEVRAGNRSEKTTALHKAVQLYRGPFLSGWYDEWVGLEQTRLAEIYAGALRRLTGYLLDGNDYERALHYARQAVQADPLREESHRLLIRLHMAMGNPAAAMQQYRELERLLRKELGAIPSGLTRELLKQIPTPQTPDTAGTPASQETTMPPATYAPFVTGTVPVPLTQFFGRREEMAALTELLRPDDSGAMPRLVTVTGIGGTGKSRIAIEVAKRLREAYEGRIYYAPLADLTSLGQVIALIASVLRLPPQPDITPTEQIFQALTGKRSLLVIDNFEPVMDVATEWLRLLLEQVADLTCLVTSRYRLGLTGEREVPLAPLPTPTVELSRSAELLSNIASVALFVDRARLVRSDFHLSLRNAEAVATICAKLDGLPLAIELAAAWTRLLTPAQIQDRLNERFDLLVATQNDVPQRHRSLRAVLDESYYLIPEEARAFFAYLSVFRGGWTLPAAEVVTGEVNALELLGLLQKRALVISFEEEQGYRFQMMETVREYAATCLGPSDLRQIQAHHVAFFVEMASQAALYLNRRQAEEHLPLLDAEQENLDAALEYAATRGERGQFRRLTAALWRYWYTRSRNEEGYRSLEAALEFPMKSLQSDEATGNPLEETRSDSGEEVATQMDLYEGAGRLAFAIGKAARAAHFFQKGLEVAEKADASRVVAMATGLGLAAQFASDAEITYQAFARIAECHRQDGDIWATAAALTEAGRAAIQSQRNDEARALLNETIVLRESLNDTWGVTEAGFLLFSLEEPGTTPGGDPLQTLRMSESGIGNTYLALGHLAAEQSDYSIALPLLRDALEAFRSGKDTIGMTLTWERIGIASLHSGDGPGAVLAFQEALALRQKQPNMAGEAFLRRLLEQAEAL